MEDGPITKRCKAVQAQAEKIGHKLGIPEDQSMVAYAIMKIAVLEQLTDELHSIRTEQNLRSKINWGDLLSKTVKYLAGLLKGEEK